MLIFGRLTMASALSSIVKDYCGRFGNGLTIYYNRFLEYEDFEREVKMDSEGVLRVRKYKYGLLTCKNVKKILDILTNN